jgi:hypothetical protein
MQWDVYDTVATVGLLLLVAIAAAELLLVVVQLLRRRPASLRLYLDDTDAWVSNKVPTAVRLLLWGQIVAAVGVVVWLTWAIGRPDLGPVSGFMLLPIPVLPGLWAMPKLHSAVGVWCKDGWVPDVRLWDRLWWFVHRPLIAARRLWVLCRLRRTDAALYLVSLSSLPGVALGLVLAIVYLNTVGGG